MIINEIANEIFQKKIINMSEIEFDTADIQKLINEYIIDAYGNDIEKKIIELYDYEKYNDSKLMKIIRFCKTFDLDDVDILDHMWDGVDYALDWMDEELEPRDEKGRKLYANDLRKDSSINSLIEIINKYNLCEEDILDTIDLYQQVEDYIDSMNHARLYYDNQLYYDEQIEAIQEAFDNL